MTACRGGGRMRQRTSSSAHEPPGGRAAAAASRKLLGTDVVELRGVKANSLHAMASEAMGLSSPRRRSQSTVAPLSCHLACRLTGSPADGTRIHMTTERAAVIRRRGLQIYRYLRADHAEPAPWRGGAVMTATLDGATKGKREPTAEERAAEELVRWAGEQGLSLASPDGLLRQLTKTVRETALKRRCEHLGHNKHCPAASDCRRSRTDGSRRLSA